MSPVLDPSIENLSPSAALSATLVTADAATLDLADALCLYFRRPGQRWHRGRALKGVVAYDNVPQRDLTLSDFQEHIAGRAYIALATGADDQASWLGWDIDTRDESALIAAARLIEEETGLSVLNWDSGNKGYHQSVCFPPTTFRTASALQSLIERRLTPLFGSLVAVTKQQTGHGDFAVHGPGGKALSLPGGTHPVTGRRTAVVVPEGDTLRVLDDAEAAALLLRLRETCQPLQVDTSPRMLPVLPVVPPTGKPWRPDPSFFYSYRPCIDHLCQVGADRPVGRHAMTLAVIGAIKANPAIPAGFKEEEVARIVRRNAEQLEAAGWTESDADFAEKEARRLYNSIDAPFSPSCFHKFYRDTAHEVARGRVEMCLTCRFKDAERRAGEIAPWNIQLFGLGLFAHPRSKRPGLGQTAGIVYLSMLAARPLYGTGETYQGLDTFLMTYPKLKELTGIAGIETLERAVKKLVAYGLLLKAPRAKAVRRGNCYALPALDTALLKGVLTRLWGDDVTPEMVSLHDAPALEEAA